jgi:NUDIX domain
MGGVAHRLEQDAHNVLVVGSIPTTPTNSRNMKTIVSIITHVKKGESFLFRRKPAGSLPYKETWYGFGALISGDTRSPEVEIVNALKQRTGIDINLVEYLWWDTEQKVDTDGEEKFFVYLHSVSEYVSGELQKSEDMEDLAWIPISDLDSFDIVPPSRKFLTRYLNSASF